MAIRKRRSDRCGRAPLRSPVRPSMGSAGDCLGNAMCESFFATLEGELPDRRHFTTPIEARMAIFEIHRRMVQPSPPPFRHRLSITHDYENTARQNTDYRSPTPSTEAG